MNGRWSPERKAFLVRDLVRDYCQVYEGLEEQRRRFDHDQRQIACAARLSVSAGSSSPVWNAPS